MVQQWDKSTQSLREQAVSDFTIRQGLVSDDRIARWIAIRHDTLSDGDVKVSLSYDGAWQ